MQEELLKLMNNKKDGDIIDLYENNMRVNYFTIIKIQKGDFSWSINTFN